MTRSSLSAGTSTRLRAALVPDLLDQASTLGTIRDGSVRGRLPHCRGDHRHRRTPYWAAVPRRPHPARREGAATHGQTLFETTIYLRVRDGYLPLSDGWIAHHGPVTVWPLPESRLPTLWHPSLCHLYATFTVYYQPRRSSVETLPPWWHQRRLTPSHGWPHESGTLPPTPSDGRAGLQRPATQARIEPLSAPWGTWGTPRMGPPRHGLQPEPDLGLGIDTGVVFGPVAPATKAHVPVVDSIGNFCRTPTFRPLAPQWLPVILGSQPWPSERPFTTPSWRERGWGEGESRASLRDG